MATVWRCARTLSKQHGVGDAARGRRVGKWRGHVHRTDKIQASSSPRNALKYDVTTWSARTWLSFVVQKVSVALHHAVALELAHALGLSAVVDTREGM